MAVMPAPTRGSCVLVTVTCLVLCIFPFSCHGVSGRRRLDDVTEAVPEAELRFHQSHSWNVSRKFGQITAVAINAQNEIVLFHRGSHRWDQETFKDDTYAGRRDDPIPEETVVTLDQATGAEVHKWGDHYFFMPHGLTIDSDGNHWLTDVAMHQVFKFGPKGGHEPLLRLGQQFSPGSSKDSFCKPTSVAVHSLTKDVFVADGYCNSRLIQFSAKGDYIRQWGHSGFTSNLRSGMNFQIPHKVVLIEEHDEACISDRENGMIKCLDIRKENLLTAEIEKPEFGRLFSIAYAKCSPVDMWFAVSGEDLYPIPDHQIMAYAVSYADHNIVTKMAPQNSAKRIPSFTNPHDIAATKDCRNVYVVEIGPNLIWKFRTNFFGPNPDNVDVSRKSESGTTGSIQTQSSFFRSFTFMISALCLVVLSAVILVRRSQVSRDSFDLGRLLEDPEKSGFNRVSTHEVDADDGDLSDSEVEEFNVSSVRNGLKV